MCFEKACRLVVCQNGNFSLEIEQNQQNQKKKKKDFHGINVKFLLSFFCFYYLILAFLLA
ncbi:hypothetical protein AC783_03995 [Helicobacter pylori]|nr:hypothetical protein AC783_03995 [Helicobacter pylori]